MIFEYPERYSGLWQAIANAAEQNYYVEGDVVVILGRYLDTGIDHYREKWPGHKIIIYQLEPISEANCWWDAGIITEQLHMADEVWDYDINNIIYLRERCGITAMYRPILYCDQCTKHVDQDREKDIDVLFIGLWTADRADIINRFNQHSAFSFVWVTNIVHPDVDEFISRAKVVLNIHHANDLKQQEQARIFYLLSNGKEVVSSKSTYNIYGDLITEVESVEQLIDVVHQKVSSYDPLREAYTKYRFKNLTYEEVYARSTDQYLKLNNAHIEEPHHEI